MAKCAYVQIPVLKTAYNSHYERTMIGGKAVLASANFKRVLGNAFLSHSLNFLLGLLVTSYT